MRFPSTPRASHSPRRCESRRSWSITKRTSPGWLWKSARSGPPGTPPPGEREVDRGDDEPAAREVRRVVELATAAVEQARAVHHQRERPAGGEGRVARGI